MNLPGAIILVNNDLVPGVQDPLVRQLYITESMTGAEFDARVLEDPNYPFIIHANHLRILVIRDFKDTANRDLMDVAIFIKAGLASIEANKFGPPGQTYPVDRLTIYELLRNYPLQIKDLTTPPNVQNNELVPLYPENHRPNLYPYGSDYHGLRKGGRGALVEIPEDE